MSDSILPENNPSKKVNPSPETVSKITVANEAITSVPPTSGDATTGFAVEKVSPEVGAANADAKASSGSYFRGNKLFTALLAFLAGFLIFASGMLMGLAIDATHDNGGQGTHGDKGTLKQYIPENQGPTDNNEIAPRTDGNQPQDGTQIPLFQQDDNETIIPVPEVTN